MNDVIKNCISELEEVKTLVKYSADKGIALEKLEAVIKMLSDEGVTENINIIQAVVLNDISKTVNVEVIKNAETPSGIKLGLVKYDNEEYLLIYKGCRMSKARGSLTTRHLKVKSLLETNGFIENDVVTTNIICKGYADSCILSILYGYPKSVVSSSLVCDLRGL